MELRCAVRLKIHRGAEEIGGLITGTFLTLLVVPVLYDHFETGRVRLMKWLEDGNSAKVNLC